MSEVNKNNANKTPLSPLKQAFIAIETLQEKLKKAENGSGEKIAIVGMSCRLPGKVESPDQFWDFLINGGDGIVHQASNNDKQFSRWPLDKFVDADRTAKGKTVTLDAGLMKDHDKFDAKFFGIAPREAESMDPQQRLALELSYTAAQDAGYTSSALEGSNTGVYLGVGAAEYFRYCLQSDSDDAGFFVSGNTQNVISGRVSFNLGLQGPAVAVDTACSSSLVAIHLAVNALRKGECQAALAGGVNMLLDPQVFVSLSKANMLAPDGRCKTFDDSADGYVRGEGGAVLMLKTLSRAEKDGDQIHAIICGSAVNQDGRSSSLTAPNGPAQQNVIRKALVDAQVKPESVSYIESHGTGTSLGDPIEVHALNAVYGNRPSEKTLTLGALKSNIGHLEAASGVASIVKVIMSLKNKKIPGNLHFHAKNHHFDIEGSPIVFADNTTSWQSYEGIEHARAGVSSFGFSGTNCHIILGEAPERKLSVTEKTTEQNVGERSPKPAHRLRDADKNHLLVLSAKTPKALHDSAVNYYRWLNRPQNDIALHDICFSAAVARDLHPYRIAFAGEDSTALSAAIKTFADSDAPQVTSPPRKSMPRIGFMFTGQGAQYAGMAEQLYQQESVFQQSLDRCAKALEEVLVLPLLEVLWGEHTAELNQTAYTQPALFCVEYALAQLWISWGIRPTIVTGHSVGEYAAACIAGVFSLEEGVRLIAERGRLMQSLPSGGGMIVVMSDGKTVAQIVSEAITETQRASVSIGAFNTQNQTVLSGDLDVLGIIQQQCKADHIGVVNLPVSHAFHSPLMLPILQEFKDYAKNIRFAAPAIKLVSNLSAKIEDSLLQSKDYWADHIVAPVDFYEGVKTFSKEVDIVIEIGPKPTLTAMAVRNCDEASIHWLSSLKKDTNDILTLQKTLAELVKLGVNIDWPTYFSTTRETGKNVSLPVYPYQRQRFWIQGVDSYIADRKHSTETHKDHPLLGSRITLPGVANSYYQSLLSEESPAYLEHHRLFGTVIVPGASHVSMAISAVQDRYNSQQCELGALAFFQTIGVPDEGHRCAQIVLSPEASSGVHEKNIKGAFKVSSLNDETQKHEEHAWEINASGVFSSTITDTSVTLQDALADLDLSLAIEEWPMEQSGKDFYSTIWQRGYTLGSAFCWVGDRFKQGNLTLHKMVLPELPETLSPYPLYPGLIDSCFQAFGSSVPLDAEGDDIYIPFSVENLKFFKQPKASEKLWCLSKPHHSIEDIQSGKARYVGDLVLFNDKGNVFMDVHGLELRKSSAKLLKASLPGAQTRKHFYHNAWSASSISPSATVSEKLMVIIGDTNSLNLIEGLGHYFDDRDREWVSVVAGESLTEISANRFELNLTHEHEYLALFNLLQEKGFPDIGGIVRVLPNTAAHTEFPQALLLEHAIASSALVNACINGLAQPPRLSLLTQRLHSPDAVQHALWSLYRVLRVEQPQLHGRCFEIVENDTDTLHRVGADILSEDKETEVAYHEGERFVQRLNEYLPIEDIDTDEKCFQAEKEGTYVITGAFGGVGFETVQWLIQHGARHLALFVRRTPSEAQQERLNTLLEQGIDIVCYQCDLAEVTNINTAMEQVSQKQGSIVGVFHLAGVLDDKFIQQQDQHSYNKVFSPKVQATYNLDQATRHAHVQYFVCFSSIAATFGTPGQGNYAAANAYMDAVMAERKAAGYGGLSINWGPWADVGMAVANQGDSKMNAVGMEAFDVQQGLDAMGALLVLADNKAVSSEAVVTYAHLNWSQFLQNFPSADINPLFTAYQQQFSSDDAVRGSYFIALQEAPIGERQTLLAEQISGILRNIMKFSDDDDIALDLGFFDSGMDSLMSLEFRQKLEKVFDISLPPTVAFNYPTIADLIQFFISSAIDLAFVEGPDMDVAVQVNEVQPVDVLAETEDSLDDSLSEDELARLLEEQLAEMTEE